MSKNCVFCDAYVNRENKGPEDIYPKWLQREFGLQKQHLYQTVYEKENLGAQREYNFGSLFSGFICKSCNTGWMSNLEGQSKPILIPLMKGILSGPIEQAKCKIIARWLYKTVLTLHTVYMGNRIIIPEHYTYFYQKSLISEGVIIAIAPITDDEEDNYWLQNGAWSQRGITETIREYLMKSYKITMRAGKLAWRVTYFDQASNLRLNIPDIEDVRYIHPCGTNGIQWPPSGNIGKLRDLDASIVLWNNQLI